MPQLKLESVAEMAAKAKAVRRDVLLQVYKAQSGHPGGKPVVFVHGGGWAWGDRRHACPAQYAILADQGFFPKAWLETFRQYPTKLQGHAENHYTPGVEVTTGSLGQGLPQAVGIAIGLKVQKSDLNGLQIGGDVKKVMNINPVPDKWRAFGWAVKEIDGHDFTQILEALAWARTIQGQPAMICARTVKGKGVSFMENNAGWHGVAPKTDEYEKALAELAD